MNHQSSFPQQALVLAAGLGSRLRPLTLKKPKPALPVGGVPILFFNLFLLKRAGIQKIVINLYHQPKAIKVLLAAAKQLGINVEFSMERKILGTAGGIAQALQKLAKETTFVLNGDILFDLDLKRFWQEHKKSQAIATLACVSPSQAKVNSFIEYEKSGNIVRIAGKPRTARQSNLKGIFTGAHLLEPELFTNYPKGQSGCIVRQVYQPALAHGDKLQCYRHPQPWWDLGSLGELKRMDQLLWQRKAPKRIIELWQEVYEWSSKVIFSGSKG